MIPVLKEKTPEIIKKLTSAGISVCCCADFKESVWLDYTGATPYQVHGVGYPCEEMGTKTIEEELKRFEAENKDIVYCKDVDEFINKIKEIKNGRSNKE